MNVKKLVYLEAFCKNQNSTPKYVVIVCSYLSLEKLLLVWFNHKPSWKDGEQKVEVETLLMLRLKQKQIKDENLKYIIILNYNL